MHERWVYVCALTREKNARAAPDGVRTCNTLSLRLRTALTAASPAIRPDLLPQELR